MKKIFKLILAFVLIYGGIGGVIFWRDNFLNIKIENILPANPLFFYQSKNLDEDLDRFLSTRLWNDLKVIDYDKALDETILGKKSSAEFKQIKELLSKPQARELILRFLGKEFCFAVYHPGDEKIVSENALDVLSGVVFVARLGFQEQIAEFFMRFVSKIGEDFVKEKVRYRGTTYYRLKAKSQKITLSYVRRGTLIAFGIGDLPAKFCIDVSRQDRGALRDDSLYFSGEPFWLKETQNKGYVNFVQLLELMKARVIGLVEKKSTEAAKLLLMSINEDFKQMKGFKAVYFSWIVDHLTRSKFVLVFNKKELPVELESIYTCEPQINRSLVFIPQDVVGYSWSACYDFKLYWKKFYRQMEEEELRLSGVASPQSRVKSIEKQLNVNIKKDLLPALGKEAGGYLTKLNLDLNEKFPVPDFVLFLQVTDPFKAQNVVEKIIDGQPFFSLNKEDYRGLALYRIQIPAGVGITPAYTFLKDYLFFSVNIELVKQAIDVYHDEKKSLKKFERFNKVNAQMGSVLNSVTFVQSDLLMQQLINVVDWANDWVTRQTLEQQAFWSGGQKRLADVQENIHKANSELGQLRRELKKGRGDDVNVDAEVDLEKRILEKNKEIQTLKEKEAELLGIVGKYKKSPVIPFETRQALANDLIKPFLRALSNLSTINSGVLIKEDHVETLMDLYMK